MIIPSQELVGHLARELPTSRMLSRSSRLRNKVSLRAMAIRLIDLGKANWTLYRSIPASVGVDKRPSVRRWRTVKSSRDSRR